MFALVASQRPREDDDDDEFTLQAKGKGKPKARQSLNVPEASRAGLHTLDESHEFLLSASFDGNGSFLAIDPSSSQADAGILSGGLGFDGDFFGGENQVDYGMDLANDISDELARELGVGWGVDVQNYVDV